jgi:hypothetical protein
MRESVRSLRCENRHRRNSRRHPGRCPLVRGHPSGRMRHKNKARRVPRPPARLPRPVCAAHSEHPFPPRLGGGAVLAGRPDTRHGQGGDGAGAGGCAEPGPGAFGAADVLLKNGKGIVYSDESRLAIRLALEIIGSIYMYLFSVFLLYDSLFLFLFLVRCIN